MFATIFTWKSVLKYLLYVEDKERVYNNKKEEVKEHKRSSKLKDNSYSNLPIGCSSSNIYFQPLNLVSVFQFFLKSNFSWSTFCLSSQHNLPSKLKIWLTQNFLVKYFKLTVRCVLCSTKLNLFIVHFLSQLLLISSNK
jgi:hypothetical protein